MLCNHFVRKYYLIDCDDLIITGLLTPYLDHYYHMSKFSAPNVRAPQTPDDLFNYKDSSLRTTLRMIFKMLKHMVSYA